jgi:hypothetical protein
MGELPLQEETEAERAGGLVGGEVQEVASQDADEGPVVEVVEPFAGEGNGVEWQLPVWEFPLEWEERPSVAFSLVQQIDGLLHRCRGVRIERDVCAPSKEHAVC